MSSSLHARLRSPWSQHRIGDAADEDRRRRRLAARIATDEFRRGRQRVSLAPIWGGEDLRCDAGDDDSD